MKKFFCLCLFLALAVPPACAEKSASKEEIRRLLGEAQMIEGDYADAAKQYEAVLQKDPSDLKARTSLADILSWQKKYDAAVAEYEKVLQAKSGDREVKKKLAAVYAWKKDYPKAEALYQELIAQDPKDPEEKVRLAEVFLWLGKFHEAEHLLTGALKTDPKNLKAKVLLGDVCAGDRRFDEALKIYREALGERYDRKVKAKIGDVLSWTQDYRGALRIYDELLVEKDEKTVRLQKARILGWAKKYRPAVREYETILSQEPDEQIREEKNAKELYWANRVKRAIAAYQTLIQTSPENVEAMFDLSQIYSYQSMWQEAIDQYKQILQNFADHFRAREGLEKSELIAKRPVLVSGYEFFKGFSSARDVDIHKNVQTNRFYVPLNMHAGLELGYDYARRTFSDYHSLTENQARVALSYQKGPDWTAGAFFNLVTYKTGVAPVYEFGGQYSFRTFDVGQMTFSQEQRRLENNSAVIRGRYFRDDFKVRQDIDILKRWKAGTDYMFSIFSDHNLFNQVAGDTLFYFTLEPRAFYVKYRYEFRNFQKREAEYFSPQDYSLHTISARWRHFLNKEDVFFGANDLYYEAGYDFSIDSQYVISHQVLGSLVWDITKRLQVRGEGQYTHATSKIYEDAGAKGSVKYYF